MSENELRALFEAICKIQDQIGDLKTEVGEIKGTSSQILVQATKTNGRVTDLEKEVNLLKTARAYEAGAGSIKKKELSALGKLLLTVLGAMVGSLTTLIARILKIIP